MILFINHNSLEDISETDSVMRSATTKCYAYLHTKKVNKVRNKHHFWYL